MPFPIVALLAAAASDAQQRSQQGDAIFQRTQGALDQIRKRRVAELGGSPYPGMVADYNNDLRQIDSQANANRNNNIGSLLQAYLKQPSAPAEKFGDDFDSTAANLQGDYGMGNVMGKAQLDSWDKDPWGDAGF